ncbi:hypothetical protein ABZ816_14335 [Actinosynnema sp. NPDC047251]|uniref:Uncharacterized protein n=1 Tax=Saccharothrix espanaensis (strain ATCC 51144 / DSM 44229 / JCM 9112 / NBRC 15066 / NRRL 15764) TaxID=1179773 RepID=K0JUZ5_SACES|nr:hypothetical protein [Saccharothrix espanaensis]CCH29801.1 hypothetical protein BN6_24870 [Saccharothrix espanaensis DSM 44229]
MNGLVLTYVLYLVLSIALTIWVGRTLSRNGKIFLVDVFHGNEELARTVNHLLVVGFYLVNFGFVATYLRSSDYIAEAQDVFETLSAKVGTVLVVLGVLHLGNVFVLSRMRRRSLHRAQDLPPVGPDGYTKIA